MEVNRLFAKGNSKIVLLWSFTVPVAFDNRFSLLGNLSVYLFAGSEISTMVRNSAKKFAIQIRTSYLRRPEQTDPAKKLE